MNTELFEHQLATPASVMQSMMSLVNNPQFTDTPRMICVADDFSVHSLKRDNVRQIDANISDLAGNLEAVPV